MRPAHHVRDHPADHLATVGPGVHALAVTGAPGSGKTHVLRGLHSEAARSGWQATLVSGRSPDAATHLAEAWAQTPSSDDKTTGVLLVVDDLQESDQRVVALVRDLLTEVVTHRVLVAVGYRPLQMHGVDRSALVEELGRSPQLGLTDVTLEEAEDLLVGTPAEADVATVHHLSGGSLRYLLALGGSSAGSLPDEVFALARAEFGQLSSKAQEALSVCAVLGETFERELVGRLLSDGPETEAAMVELRNAYILHSDRVDGGTTGFRRPVLRTAAYQLMPEPRRRELHQRLVPELEARGAAPEVVAPHSLAAGGPDAAAVVRRLTAAAAAVRWRTPMLAAQWYEAAARLEPAAAGRWELSRIDCLISAGRLDQAWTAVVALQRAAAAADQRTEAMLHSSRIERMRGHHQESAAMLRRAGREASAVQRRRVWVELAATEIVRCDGRAALDALQDAHEVSATTAAAEQLAAAALEAFASCLHGDVGAASSAVDLVRHQLPTFSDDELAPWVEHFVWAAAAHSLLGDHRGALGLAHRLERVARSTGQQLAMPQILMVRARQLFWLGRLGEALSVVDAALAVAREADDQQGINSALDLRAQVLMSQGRLSDALADAREACRGTTDSDAWDSSPTAVTLAEIYALTDRIDEALDLLTSDVRLDPDARARRVRAQVAAHLADGNYNDAASAVDTAKRNALSCPLDIVQAQAGLAAAELGLAMGQHDTALELGRDAADLFRRTGRVLDGLAAQRVVGLSLAGQRGKAEASQRLKAALVRARELGAGRLIDVLEADVAELHSTPSTLRPQNRLTLMTRREWEVAEHVVHGLTNKQIAAQLYLSERTVERHLSRIFTKLNISSRAALAALVSVHGGQASAS